MNVSIIIPLYNEDESLLELYDKITNAYIHPQATDADVPDASGNNHNNIHRNPPGPRRPRRCLPDPRSGGSSEGGGAAICGCGPSGGQTGACVDRQHAWQHVLFYQFGR